MNWQLRDYKFSKIPDTGGRSKFGTKSANLGIMGPIMQKSPTRRRRVGDSIAVVKGKCEIFALISNLLVYHD